MKIESSDTVSDDCIAVVIQVLHAENEYFSTMSLQLPEKEEINIVEVSAAISGIEHAHEQLTKLMKTLEDDFDE
jgi:hypothetical protein